MLPRGVASACGASTGGAVLGGKPRYTPAYVGTECVDNAFDAAGCPVPGACGYGTTDGCLLWQRGVFVSPHRGWGAANSELPLPPACSAASDADGRFVGGVWTPKNSSCRLACFTPWQAARLLSGRRVLFAGDSMLRQLFMHFVAFLRELDVVEQPFRFHNGAVYARSGDADALCVSKKCLHKAKWLPAARNGTHVRLRFLWSPRHVVGEPVRGRVDEDNTPYEFKGDIKADAVVTGLLYHLPAEDTLEKHLPALSKLAAGVPVMWVTTASKENSLYSGRNAVLRAWAAQTRNARILALDKLAADGKYKPAAGPHFACEVDVHQSGEHQHVCKDAHDTVNGNLVQMILAHLAAAGWGAVAGGSA